MCVELTSWMLAIEKNLGKNKYGLVTRLDSHAKARLSGDQFNAYKNRSGEVKN